MPSRGVQRKGHGSNGKGQGQSACVSMYLRQSSGVGGNKYEGDNKLNPFRHSGHLKITLTFAKHNLGVKHKLFQFAICFEDSREKLWLML